MNGFQLLVTAFSLIEIACSRVFVPGSNQGANSVKVYPGTVQNGISHAQFSSSTGNDTGLFTGVDSPKLDFINSTVTQWWYFDAVSTDLLNSLTIIFFTSTSLAFPFILPNDSVTVAYVWATFPNGTVYTGYTTASFATITTIGDGSSGSWESTGFKWDGDPKMQKYIVTIESNEMDISGTLELDSVRCTGSIPLASIFDCFLRQHGAHLNYRVLTINSFFSWLKIAPAHYPSGPVNDKEKQSLEIAPHIGWTNAIPDSKGTVNFNIKGADLQFEGSAYHDQVSSIISPCTCMQTSQSKLTITSKELGRCAFRNSRRNLVLGPRTCRELFLGLVFGHHSFSWALRQQLRLSERQDSLRI